MRVVRGPVTSTDADTHVTHLGYGVNQDQFVDMPEAFVRKPDKIEAARREALPPLTTRLKGKIADAEGRTIYIDVTVTSTARRVEGEVYGLFYTVTLGENSEPILLNSEEKRVYSNHPLLKWESPESEGFQKGLKEFKEKVLTIKHRKHHFFVKAQQMRVVEKKLILIQGDKKIASVSAPAYAPDAR